MLTVMSACVLYPQIKKNARVTADVPAAERLYRLHQAKLAKQRREAARRKEEKEAQVQTPWMMYPCD